MIDGTKHYTIRALADLLKQLEAIAALDLFGAQEFGGSDGFLLRLADGLLSFSCVLLLFEA